MGNNARATAAPSRQQPRCASWHEATARVSTPNVAMPPFEIPAAFLVPVLPLLLLLQRRRRRSPGPLSIGFLHPHSLSGGGGERVLWCALLSASRARPDARLVLYTADDAGGSAACVARAEAQFGLDLSALNVHIVPLARAWLVDPAQYPRLTLLAQALGAAALGAGAYASCPVDVFVDTANLSFALLFPWVCGARTVSYVHYPTISADMVEVVRGRTERFNNTGVIARSALLSAAKLAYYRVFALLYALVALCCDVPLANSSWTRNHLRALWWRPEAIVTIFPPCPVACDDSARTPRDPGLIVSLGQFRPEKNHALQLDMLEHLAKMRPQLSASLIMAGGARHEEDEMRAKSLLASARRRDLPVTIRVNVPRTELTAVLARATIGIHTMTDEHFGISVVELQAAGLVAIAHRSGGVALDIVEHGVNGFLAESAEEYAGVVADVLEKGEDSARAIRAAAIRDAARFSDERFVTAFGAAVRKACSLVPGGLPPEVLTQSSDVEVS